MEQLFKEFEGVSASVWKQQLEKDLKGITFEQLSKSDGNGINIQPFYTLEDNAKNIGTANLFNHTDWDILSPIIVKDELAANNQALQLLNDGVSGLFFELASTVDLNVLLQGIELPFITVVFKVSGNTNLFKDKLEQYSTTAGYNQLSNTFVYGEGATDKQQIIIDASAYNNRGANSTTELAAITATLQEHLAAMDCSQTTSNLPIYIQVAVDTLFYEQIAKLRALRILVHNVTKAYSLTPQIYIHAVTSHVYRSHVDMQSNMLRDTLSAMASVLGGANGVTVFPYDYYVQEPSNFSHRMAKNIQLLLREEAYLHLTGDVSSGSFYLEELTRQLAEEAWRLFLKIENKGGLFLNVNILNEEILQQATALIQAYRDGKKILIGVNKHKNNMEATVPSFNAGQVPIPTDYINIAQVLS